MVTIFMVICTVLNFGRYTHAQQVSSPVCKWDYSKSTCEKDPLKMIQLLTSTNKMFGLLMRCQYETSKYTCNNISQNTCIWENNACRISSKELINQINECFYQYLCQNEIKKCKIELQNISENITWINKIQVRPAPSCKDTVGCFSFIKDTCIIMQYALQCTSYNNYRCTYGITGTQAYQLVSDIRYIMGISSQSVSSSLSFLENKLDIKSGNLQLYDKCNNSQSRYQCNRKSSISQNPSPRYLYSPSPRYYFKPFVRIPRSLQPKYYISPSPSITRQDNNYNINNNNNSNNNKINGDIVIAPITCFLFICSSIFIFCQIVRRQLVQNTTQTVDGNSQNFEMTARTTTGQQTGDLETASTVDIIELLPNLEFQVQEGHENSESICCICLENFQEGDSSTVSPCAHWFHKQCFDEWIKTRGRNVSCPLCNATLQNNTLQSQQ